VRCGGGGDEVASQDMPCVTVLLEDVDILSKNV